jgi:hypothetical protein
MTRPTTVVIPTTIKKATEALNGIDSLLTAKGWERAAIVQAFTKPGTGGPRTAPDSVQLSIRQFAELGINGLRKQDTIRAYRQAWEDGGGDPDIKPGATVKLPTIGFPPSDNDEVRKRVRVEPGSSPEQIERAVETMTPAQRKTAIKKLIEVEPEIVADVVSDDRSVVSDVATKYEEKAVRHPKKERELGALDTIGILTELPVAIDKADTAVDGVVEKAETFSRLLRKGSVPSAEAVVAEVVADIAKVQHKLGVAVALIEDGLSSVGKSVEELL